MRLSFPVALFALALAGPAAAQITGTITDETPAEGFVVAVPPLATPADVATPAGQTGDLAPIWA